jgi:hypothetical protein
LNRFDEVAIRSVGRALLASCTLAAVVAAQTTIASGSGSFVDISPAGNNLGTAITGVTNNSSHTITTTIGNALFPAGSVRVGANGFAMSTWTAATVGFTNATIPAAGLPAGVTAGAFSYLMPFWDDLDPIGSTGGSITLYYWQDTSNDVLYMQWNNEGHFPNVAGQTVTFQVQVFGNASACTTFIKYAYLDTTFGGTQASLDSGASATIGYVAGAGNSFGNAPWSFTVSAGTTLSIGVGPTYLLTATSPGGPGTLRLDFSGGPCVGGTYILAVTLVEGLYPAGWLYGLDIPIAQLAADVMSGFPFVGPLVPAPWGSEFTLGPFSGLPSGLQFWAVGLALPTGGNGAPTAHTPPMTHVVP